MTKRVSCIPCSKRKVRCDRQEPCAHCKRRKIENCTYPDESPAARIKHLEALVRSLGRDPDADCVDGNALTPESPATAVPRARPSHRDERVDYRSPARVAPDSNPVIAENGGERVYLESYVYQVYEPSILLIVLAPHFIAGTERILGYIHNQNEFRITS